MTASTHKRILLRRFEREPLAGFVNPSAFLHPSGIEVMTVEGAVLLIPYGDVKALYFVRDFESHPPAEDAVFHTRPKMNGVWIRLRFRDGDLMEGVLPNNLLQLEPQGYTFVPPNPTSNNQKVFVPREALSELQVVGVVGSPLRLTKAKPKPKEQIELFE